MIFFGCYKTAGHFAFTDSARRVSERELDVEGWLCGREIDASRLLLPWIATTGEATLTYLPGPNITVLAWWGSPWDSRPKVNNSLQMRGNASWSEMWAEFNETMPEIARHFTGPTRVLMAPAANPAAIEEPSYCDHGLPLIVDCDECDRFPDGPPEGNAPQ